MSKYWSRSLDKTPTRGYEAPGPHYVSERGNNPVSETVSEPTNRRGRRLAARALGNSVASIDTYTMQPEINFLIEPEFVPEAEAEVENENEPTPEYQLGNFDLPIAAKRHEIVESIRNNQVTIVVSETGSGKSTQIIQYILEDLGKKVTQTQPRRLATRNIAQRVQEEISSVRPDMQGVIAEHTAEKDTRTEHTLATVCTDGLRFVKQLHDDGSLAEEVLIIDEVHEWNTNIEMLVGWTRELLKTNPHMRIVLTSATMDATEISNFYADVTDTVPPIIEAEGRTFPVDKKEEPESTVVEEILREEHLGKNILVFLPGVGEIKDVTKSLRARFRKMGIENIPEIVPLHSKLSESEQDKAFRSYAHGKIVLSTNVAETSLTIPDIDVVIDSGLERQKEIDDEGAESLPLVPISQDSCDQRGGRAGRVKNGIYRLTRLGKGSKFIPYMSRDKHSTPEILRTDVDKNILHFASIGIDLEHIKIPHPIKKEVIQRSKRAMRLIGALDDSDIIALTHIGRRMEMMSLHPMFARMVIESEQYSLGTQAQVAALAAASDVGGLKYFTKDSKKRWKSLSDESESDLLAELDIFIASMNMSNRERQEHDLDVKNAQRAEEQYEKMMRNIGFKPSDLLPPSPKERENIKRCIYAGMIDHIYQYAGSGEYMRINGQTKTPREISNRSVVRNRPMLLAGTPYVVSIYKGGDRTDKHIVEKVTQIKSPEILAEIALNLCTWEPTERKLRSGQLIEAQNLEFRGVPMGVSREVSAPSDDEAKRFMVNHIMETPGSALRELYAIESRLKSLRKLSQHAPKSIQNLIRQVVEESVEKSNLDETYADHLIRRRNITLADFISDEERHQIEISSPHSISRFGWDFKLDYQSGAPLVKRYNLEDAMLLPDDITLDDGRKVKFVGEHGKRYTVAELKAGRHKSKN